MKKYIYYAKSEYGVKKFYKFKTLMNFLRVYYPKWIHKIKVYKIKGKNKYVGQYSELKNGGLKVKF